MECDSITVWIASINKVPDGFSINRTDAIGSSVQFVEGQFYGGGGTNPRGWTIKVEQYAQPILPKMHLRIIDPFKP